MKQIVLLMCVMCSLVLAQENQPTPNKMLIPAPCKAVWMTVVQAMQPPMPFYLVSSNESAGYLSFAGTGRASDDDSNKSVRTVTTARFTYYPRMWTEFGVDAMNFYLTVAGNESCSVVIEMKYSAKNKVLGKLLPLNSNGSVEADTLSILRDKAKNTRPNPPPPPPLGPASDNRFGAGAYRIGEGVSAPSVLTKVEPEYSEEARAAKWQGTVVLSLVVDEQGRPQNLTVLRSLGMGLDEKAMEAVKQWRFNPGMKDGKGVPVASTIEVNFRLLYDPGEIQKAQATADSEAAEERAKTRAACGVVYNKTVDKKVGDLTVRETQQVQACQALGFYPPR